MPLALVDIGKKCIVKSFTCSCDVRMRIVNMGIVPGSIVAVLNRINGSVLIKIGQSRLVIDCCLADKIRVC